MDDLQDRIIFIRKAVPRNDKVALQFPDELQKALGFNIGDRLSMFVDKGKHGKYLAIWKDPAEQKVPESESDEDEQEKSSIQEF